MPRLHGEVVLVDAPHPAAGAVLHIRLLDVSRADAAATVVAEDEIPAVTLRSVDDRVGFLLDLPDLDPRATYTLEAHLDIDGSGQTTVGDYRTMEHIPVSPGAPGGPITVRLRPVT